MTTISGLYEGVVGHTRIAPREHRLRYRVFFLYLDLDEVAALDRRLALFSAGRFNLVSFAERAHGDGSGRPLKAQIEAELAKAGLAYGGPIRLLAMPRILGKGFNPLTVYFCHRRDGTLSAMLYEVNNTFGERHSYLIPAAEDHGMVRQHCQKAFYVSPFMDFDLAYAFRVRPPGETVQVAIDVSDTKEMVLSANFLGRRRRLTDVNLLKAWATHPWMTLGVFAAIHVEALKYWLKGGKLRPRPAAPERRVTVVGEAKLAA